jgi:signal peptidase I
MLFQTDMESTLTKISATETFRFYEEILNNGLNLRVKVTGRSMTPFLKGGEILTIKKVPCSSLLRGDLIYFKNRYNFPIIHRIIKKRQADNGMSIFQTKGDALIAFDESVHENDVLGKVCRIEKSSLDGKTKHIDMESRFWRIINYFLTLINICKSKIYSAVFKLKSAVSLPLF